MAIPLPILAVPILALAGLGGCAGSKSAAVDPPVFRLLLGKGGGFTGRWHGHMVHTDGTVWTWQGLGTPGESLLVATLDAASLDSLRFLAQQSGLLDVSTEGAGNLSARLEITLGDRTTTLRWASGLYADAPDRPEERFYSRLQRFLALRMPQP